MECHATNKAYQNIHLCMTLPTIPSYVTGRPRKEGNENTLMSIYLLISCVSLSSSRAHMFAVCNLVSEYSHHTNRPQCEGQHGCRYYKYNYQWLDTLRRAAHLLPKIRVGRFTNFATRSMWLLSKAHHKNACPIHKEKNVQEGRYSWITTSSKLFSIWLHRCHVFTA